MGVARGIRARYGGSLAHLVLVLGSFALTGYAGLRLLRGDTLGIVIWFVGAALLHDLVLLPLYTVTDRAVQHLFRRRRSREAASRSRPVAGRIDYVRVPACLALLLLLVWYPLVLGRVSGFSAYTGLPADVFWGRWLLITAVLFAVSAVCLLVSVWRARPRRPKAGSSDR
ncbi:hypothetical protein K2224_32940 (plasmid) [Streptomyces sp. BHT-5-2]|uniref:hypothetical protein n=1 Tax=unclassified Streptomyces TaxID=2593676 RepID=UPI001C8ED78A|nr:hypothetical protein [Streptomyces sp. BHT-5-2]QZL09271.1 hypothetical protein K2224_32940 [Streptomyces sp. BHT-5-2]